MRKKLLLAVSVLVIILLSSCKLEPKITIRPADFSETMGVSASVDDATLVCEKDLDSVFNQKVYVYEKTTRGETIILENGESSIEFEKGSFIAYYKHPLAIDELKMSEEEVIELAESYLLENNLLPNGFKYSRIGKATRYSTETEETITTAITVRFERELDNHEVIGLSKITATYNSEGLCEVVLAYSDYEDKTKVNTMSYDEFTKILYGDSVFWAVEEENIESVKADKLTIEEIQLVYVDIADSTSIKYIQPYFRVLGVMEGSVNTKFQALVPALSEGYYK